FEQVLSLVRQLPKQQKIQLSRELEKEVIDSKLSKLLNTFKSDELDLEVIEEEVENVRQEMYEKQKH
ncbi:MAG: type II toxin-antitoxin system VapB15 family antitoxin, partial [Runella zeae]